MRCTRRAFKIAGFLRSSGVIDWMIASIRISSRSSNFMPSASASEKNGSRSITSRKLPIFLSKRICSKKSDRVNLPDNRRLASCSAFFSSMSLLKSFIKLTTSPMPRMRLAMPSARKGSSLSSPSPIPTYLTGAPVTILTDSAAPPRASPSSLVSTTPSMPTFSLKCLAVVTASWPIIASMTSSTWSGGVCLRIVPSSSISC